jgi:hypothetical protein
MRERCERRCAERDDFRSADDDTVDFEMTDDLEMVMRPALAFVNETRGYVSISGEGSSGFFDMPPFDATADDDDTDVDVVALTVTAAAAAAVMTVNAAFFVSDFVFDFVFDFVAARSLTYSDMSTLHNDDREMCVRAQAQHETT